jgi:branched-chain amino acid transport system substrate-binding protein
MKRGIFALFALVLVTSLISACGAAPQQEQAAPAAEPIVIGVPTALGSIEGADALRAVEMAVEEINAAGGVSVGDEKRPFKVVSIDTREHEAGIPVHDALAAVEKLILEEEPDAIVVGAFRSEVLMASMDLISEHKIPYITSIAMTPAFQQKITEDYDSYKYLFRNSNNAIFFTGYIIQTMNYLGQEFGFNKVYILYQDVLWATGTANGVEGWLNENGWEVVGKDAYPIGATDFSSSLTKAGEAGVQVIVPIFDMPESGILLKDARNMQPPALITGFISPAASASAWDTFEGELDGMVTFSVEVGPVPVQAVPKSVEFNTRYGEKYGADLQSKLSGHGPAPAYDSVYILADAIERAGTLDPDALVTALEATDLEGAVGRIKFSEDHQVIYGTDPKEGALGVAFQWVDGKRIPVFPEAAAEGKIALPEGLQ